MPLLRSQRDGYTGGRHGAILETLFGANWRGTLPKIACALIAGGLIALMSSGCAPKMARKAYGYEMILPTLEAIPAIVECELPSGSRTCVLLVMEDYYAIIAAMKAACLALGGEDGACQTEE